MKNLALAGVLSMLSVLGAVSLLAPARAADDSLPVGTIVAWGGAPNSAPAGWMSCNGRALNKSVYKELFTAIGTSWGSAGDKFNLPDLRGRFLRGEDAGTGRDPDVRRRLPSNPGGNATGVGSVQGDSLQNHTHDQAAHNHSYAYPNLASEIADTGSGLFVRNISSSTAPTTSVKPNLLGAMHYGTKSSLSTGEESRPENAAVNFIIKVR